ncbi:hypothetical protein PPACK8108_LOCUS1062 [Phakopsora pachyrhizi]|uniref:Uncharacterized protein n=1 Tax=Phakopsora pachyrhizi TaxID=170000 RepID=A0AAV0AIY9_PHAPC|nr:hypothetical protein PPACK8108_LOCUS1062 [Phakopsora pachyrhizi]
MNNQEKVLENADLSASNPKITCFSGQHFSFFSYGSKPLDQSKGMPGDGAYIWFRKQTRDSPKQIMKLNKHPVGRFLKMVKLLPEPNFSQRTKEARLSINVYGKKNQTQSGKGSELSAINLLIDFISDSPYLIHHLSMTRIPDYLMESTTLPDQAEAGPPGDASAQATSDLSGQLDQSSDLLCESLRKMIIKREMMMAHSSYSKISYKTAFSVRPMEYISKLYDRDLPDINDPKTIRDTTNHREIKPSENIQVIRGDDDVDVESTGQGDPIGAAKEGPVVTADIRGHLTRRVRHIWLRIDMLWMDSIGWRALIKWEERNGRGRKRNWPRYLVDKGQDKEDKGLQEERSRTLDEDKKKNKRGSIGVKNTRHRSSSTALKINNNIKKKRKEKRKRKSNKKKKKKKKKKKSKKRKSNKKKKKKKKKKRRRRREEGEREEGEREQ